MTDPDARRALRLTMRARREALTPPLRLAAADAVARHLRGLDAFAAASTVAGYWAVRGELPLHALLAPTPSFDYCLPLLCAQTRLRFAPWRFGEPLQANRYGIPEPAVAIEATLAPDQLDVVLLPLLAFDLHGHRLGSGAGYYDRSFAFLQSQPRPTRPLLVGVGYAFQQVERLANQPWDVALDYVATDTGLIACAPA